MSQVEVFAEKIKESKKIVILTGSGISVASGIPDFRSKDGIYQERPEYLLSFTYFQQHPKEFYDFLFESLYYPDAKPNAAHKILAQWEALGKEITIITQNIDGFHQLAGSTEVIPFHGDIRTATCLNPKCRCTYTLEQLIERRKSSEIFYVCSQCKEGYIKPDVVLYEEAGEWMHPEKFRILAEKIYDADAVMVLGTTLIVYPFASLVDAKRHSTPLLIINHSHLHQETMPNTYTIHDDISKVLIEIQEKIEQV